MNQTLKLFDKWFDRISDVLSNRTKVLNPFRLDANKHIYQFGLTPEQWAAFRMLRPVPNFRGAISTTWHASVTNIPEGMKFRQFHIALTRPEAAHFYPAITTPWDALPKSVQQYLTQWVEVDLMLTAEEHMARGVLRRVTSAANTWAQLARVWPSLVPFFPDKEEDARYRRQSSKAVDWRRKATMSRTKGKLCDDLTNDGGEVHPEWIDQIDEVGWIFAQCMMLPEYDHKEHGSRPDVRYR